MSLCDTLVAILGIVNGIAAGRFRRKKYFIFFFWKNREKKKLRGLTGNKDPIIRNGTEWNISVGKLNAKQIPSSSAEWERAVGFSGRSF